MSLFMVVVVVVTTVVLAEVVVVVVAVVVVVVLTVVVGGVVVVVVVLVVVRVKCRPPSLRVSSIDSTDSKHTDRLIKTSRTGRFCRGEVLTLTQWTALFP